MAKFDFSGWATRNDIECSDGRTIRRDAFKDNDGKTVPLVWNHQHDAINNVLGHALLENRDEGVYAYCSFNDTVDGQKAKKIVQHGDIVALSIYANKLRQRGKDVIHGAIREVSLVLAGANPGAFINDVVAHSDDSDYEAEIYLGEGIALYHGEDLDETPEEEKEDEQETDMSHADDSGSESDSGSNSESDGESESKSESDSGSDSEETVRDILKTMNEKQRTATAYVVQKALEEGGDSESTDDNEDSEGGNDNMKHNVFDTEEKNGEGVLTHSEEVKLIEYAKDNHLSLKRVVREYASENEHLAHGIDDIESLFPEYRDVRPGAPELITRDLTWVDGVMNGVHKSPYTRIRTRQADARGTDLRAFGYNKKGAYKQYPGNIKLLKRTTDPQTVYVRDALHRDDIIDIEDFDVVNYQYQIMRNNLNEELAMAIMIGDGRDEGDEQKIQEDKIRPIWTDDDLYTIHYDVDIDAARASLQGTDTGTYFGDNYVYAEAIVTAALYSREKYKGSGSLEFYCTPHLLNVMLLARDRDGRRIYSSVNDLAAALNVSRIETAEQFEGKIRTTDDAKKKKLLGLFVNLKDYSLGCAKGGQITRFNQFDIDFNQEKYLLETRVSGALTRVWSAIALEEDVTE